jgi:hypothetical protein
MSDRNLPDRVNGTQPTAMDAIPGLVRLAATSWLRTTQWSVVAGVKTGRRVLKVATDPSSAADLVKSVATAGTVAADIARTVSNGASLPQAVIQVSASLGGGPARSTTPEATKARQLSTQQSLRDQGRKLLDKSRDVWNTDQAHPAYERILSEMAPDEGRILLLLLKSGPQPSVDVRTGGAVGMVSSTLVAPGLNMIGPRAGVRYLDQVPSYLNNLFRLGLIWFSREQLRDPMEYQVVEAQPDVVEAMHSVRAAKVVRRSIHLTPFGEDFCRTCLLDERMDTATLPEHQAPQDLD